MKACIVGPGAVGGFIGARLALSGEAEVAAVARGATLDALRTHGWRLEQDGKPYSVPARVSAEPAELGPQDVVFICVKAPALPALAPRLAPLLGSETLIVPAMNGAPWWFTNVIPELGGTPLRSIDPDGLIGAALPATQVVGCVVHVSAETREPGLTVHTAGTGLILGEPAGGRSPRVDQLAALLGRTGFDATVSANVKREVWYKLWGNLTANPLSALTGATMDRILDDELVREFCKRAMREIQEVGDRIGCGIDQTPEDRLAVTRRLGAFRTSMLQDADAGRPIELDGIVGVVREIALRVGVPTPTIDAIFGLTRLYGRVRGLYPR